MKPQLWKDTQNLQVVREGEVLHGEVRVASTFFSRLMGLIGRKKLRESEGLILTRCREIHMWFMSIPIDVVFLQPIEHGSEEKWKVVGLRENLQPWKLLPVGERQAEITLELAAGSIRKRNWNLGQNVTFTAGGQICTD